MNFLAGLPNGLAGLIMSMYNYIGPGRQNGASLLSRRWLMLVEARGALWNTPAYLGRNRAIVSACQGLSKQALLLERASGW